MLSSLPGIPLSLLPKPPHAALLQAAAVAVGEHRSLSRAEAQGLVAAVAAERWSSVRQLARAGWLHRLCSRSSCSWQDWHACKHIEEVLVVLQAYQNLVGGG
jgi:hypothetical protein